MSLLKQRLKACNQKFFQKVSNRKKMHHQKKKITKNSYVRHKDEMQKWLCNCYGNDATVRFHMWTWKHSVEGGGGGGGGIKWNG